MVRKRVADAGADLDQTDPERQGSPTMNVAVISGATFINKSVVYYEVGGVAIVEGDIALGTVEQVQAITEAARSAVSADPSIAFGVGITGSQFRWPNCRVPYEIDPVLPNQQRVTDAIAHWEANTAFRFPVRTTANAPQHPNYIRFTDQGGCWSFVGMQGGQQLISLGAGCTTGNAIHEIGHAIGLWHEQSREDRDLFVTINWQNIQSGMSAQFNQHITDGDDLGAYDYGSIMHYPRTAFSSNGQDTITPPDPTIQIGQRNGLSAGDIAAVREMYPTCGVIKPPFIEPGHQFKKLLDDRERFKKFRDDPIGKPVRDPKPIRDPKSIRDPKPPRDPKTLLDPGPKHLLDPGPKNVLDPGPKGLSDPIGRPGPGTLQPFSMATPHHASSAIGFAGLAMQGSNSNAYLMELQQQLLDLEAAIAESHAAAAHANADIARLQQASSIVAAAYAEAASQNGP